MKFQLPFLAGALAVALSACAAPDAKPAGAEAPKAKEYVTGSMIPRRSRSEGPAVTIVDPGSVQNSMNRATVTGGSGKSGGGV